MSICYTVNQKSHVLNLIKNLTYCKNVFVNGTNVFYIFSNSFKIPIDSINTKTNGWFQFFIEHMRMLFKRIKKIKKYAKLKRVRIVLGGPTGSRRIEESASHHLLDIVSTLTSARVKIIFHRPQND